MLCPAPASQGRDRREVLRTWAPGPAVVVVQVRLSLALLVGVLCPVITPWVTRRGPAAAFYSLLCQVMQNLSILLIFGADDPSPRLGPGLGATLEKERKRWGLRR